MLNEKLNNQCCLAELNLTWKCAQQLKQKQKRDKCQNEFKSEEVWLVAESVTNISDVDERKLCRSSEVKNARECSLT